MENKNELFLALLSFKKDIQSIKKNRTGRFKYVDLDGIMESIRPSLIENNLFLIHTTDFCYSKSESEEENKIPVTFLKTTLMHSSGQFIESRIPLSSFYNFDTFDNQEGGKNITYLKRYLTMAILNITLEEDPNDSDGNSEKRATDNQKKYIAGLSSRYPGRLPTIMEKLNISEIGNISMKNANNIIEIFKELNM